MVNIKQNLKGVTMYKVTIQSTAFDEPYQLLVESWDDLQSQFSKLEGLSDMIKNVVNDMFKWYGSVHIETAKFESKAFGIEIEFVE